MKAKKSYTFYTSLLSLLVYSDSNEIRDSVPVEQSTLYFFLFGDCLIIIVFSVFIYFLGNYLILFQVSKA